jgi:anthranilate synthase component 1
MIYPDKKRYVEDATIHNLVPVFQELRADFETPLSIFVKVRGKFLLESIERGENVGRFSIIALGKKSVITLESGRLKIEEREGEEMQEKVRGEYRNPLTKVREYLKQFSTPDYTGLPPFFGGAIGYLGYETVQYFENIPINEEEQPLPDGLMIIPEIILVYDTIKRSVNVIVSTTPGDKPQITYDDAVRRINEISAILSKPLVYREQQAATDKTISVRHHVPKDTFLEAVKKCKEYIRSGEIIQAVLSQKFSLQFESRPFELYRTLRIINPSPYLFYLDFDDFCLVGSSPEVMVRVQNREILLKPIAGTRQRGRSLAEDNALSRELMEDPKERAEHLMLVDLGRNDLGRVAIPGSIEVSDFMNIEKYSHVMHIVSTIKGELDEQYDVFDVIAATFPAGTLSGAPKIRAMEIIAELEGEKRGPYGGMVFNLVFNGNMDSCITIRSIVIQGRTAVVQAGAGIVADSIPEKEYQETVDKAQALIDTIQQTDHGRIK